MALVYLGLGANLGDPPAQLDAALHAVSKLPGTRLLARSSLYRSAPLGPAGQPDYCNAVCLIATALPPLALLDALQGIEDEAGRDRNVPRWAARLLDLDILHVEGVLLSHPRLTLPHPGIADRNWVLVPLAEIAPALVLPELGEVAVLAARLGMDGLSRWPLDAAGWPGASAVPANSALAV